MKTIVVGTDGSDHAASALDTALELAHGLIRHGTRPILVVAAASERSDAPSVAAPTSSVASDA